MYRLGSEARDIILVIGDACVDYPSFGMAIIGRLLVSMASNQGP